LIDDYCRPSCAKDTRDTPDQPQESPLAKAIMDGKSVAPREYLRYNDDGTSTWISLTAAPVIDLDGKVSGCVVAIQDIDEDKREMHRLEELATALKNKLATHR
jgi:PAS domain S-box-containing protein